MASWKPRQLAGPAAAAAVFALACLFAPPASGAAGDLDPSFSEDGRLSLVAAGPFVARGVAVAPDGGVVVAGYSCAPDPATGNGICQTDGDSSFRLARFTADGGLDSEFGDKGLVTTPVGVGRSQAFDLLIAPNGKIVVGGVARDAESQTGRDTFALARYEADGALDRSFGTQGTTLTRIGTGFAAIADLAAAPDGSIVATGQAHDAEARPRLAVARFTPDGTLDTGFNAPLGYALAGAAAYNYGLGAAVGGDGGVIAAGIAGTSSDPAGHRFAAVKLGPTGAADAGFDGDGAAEYTVGSSSSFANAVAARGDGTWVAAGAATADDGRQAMAVIRGNPAGGLDPAWDGDGIALMRTADGAVANDLALLPDGRVIAIGQAASGGGYAFALARFTAAGALDASFASTGSTATSWANFPIARGTAAALLPDGRVVVTGIGCQGGTQSNCQGGTAVLLLARYLADPPPPGPPPPPPGPGPDVRAPGAAFVGLPSAVRRRGFVRRGLMLRVRVDEDAEVAAVMLGRGSGRRVLADRRGRRADFKLVLRRRALGFARGLRRMRLRPRTSAVSQAQRFTVRIVVEVRDRAGNVTRLQRSVKIR